MAMSESDSDSELHNPSSAPKISEDESKITRRRPRTPNYGLDHETGAAEQDKQCAVAALAHFNQEAASTLGVTYELVKAGLSAAFMPGNLQPGFFYHTNFTAKPANCTDGSQTVLFFAELYEPYREPPRVTVCCILGPADNVGLGYNGCENCGPGPPVIHHPVGGFYPGAGLCPLSPLP